MTKPSAEQNGGRHLGPHIAGSSGRDENRAESRAQGEHVPRSLRRLTCVSVTYQTHSTEVVGHLTPADPLDAARTLTENDRVTEAIVLGTCNRFEVYVSTRTPDREDRETALTAMRETFDVPAGSTTYSGLEVATHLARVTAGLESAILGEDEIAGQVGRALAGAKEAGLAAGVLGRAGNAALRAGRTCRAETAINEGPADYGSAACRTLVDDLDDTPDRLLVIGAGTMARRVVDAATCRWEVQVDVANRTPAQKLPTPDGDWWTLDELAWAIPSTDAIVTATGADHPVLEAQHVEGLSDGTPVVDLATPPDVAPAARTNGSTAVTDLDALGETVASATEQRKAAASEAESILGNAIDRLVEQERENRAEDVIRELHQQAASIRTAELERALARLEDGEATPEEVMEDAFRSLTGQLLGPATDELRTAARERDETALRAARRLFDLEGGETDD